LGESSATESYLSVAANEYALRAERELTQQKPSSVANANQFGAEAECAYESWMPDAEAFLSSTSEYMRLQWCANSRRAATDI